MNKSETAIKKLLLKMNIHKLICLCIYYGVARFLPPSHKNIIGVWGGMIRLYCARHLFKYCAHNANIEHMASFGDGHDIEIGSRSCIGIHCNVPNDIKIGNDVMMGPYCYILENVTHVYERTDVAMIFQGSKKVASRTMIGDDVWMGRQCIMISGKTIGNHCIIGAGSVVCRNIPDWMVAGGNPIRIIRDRRNHKL